MRKISPNISFASAITMLVSIAAATGCSGGKAKTDSSAEARSIFLADVRAEGIKVSNELPDGRIELTLYDSSVTVSLDNQIR